MNDKQFSVGIRVSAVIAVILLIVIGIAVFYILRSTNVSTSILEDVPNAVINQTQVNEVKEN